MSTEVRHGSHWLHHTKSNSFLSRSSRRNERLQAWMQQMNSCVTELKKWKRNTQLLFCWTRLGNRWNNNCRILDFMILVNTVGFVPLIEKMPPCAILTEIQFWWAFHSSCKSICALLVVSYLIWWLFSEENSYVERTLQTLIFLFVCFQTSFFTFVSGTTAEMCLFHYLVWQVR